MTGTEGRAEICLWHLVAGRGPAPEDGLTDVELRRARGFRSDRDRDRFVFFRGALRRILGACLAVEPGRVPLVEGGHEKPRVPPRDGAAELHFNLSHSGDQGLLAVCRTAPVGIDIEMLRPVRGADHLVARFFSAAENAAYRALPPEQQTVGFLRGWTRKEAYLKATGTGLSFSPERMSVTLGPDETARLIAVDGDPEAPGRWHLADCDPAADSVAALAVAAPAARLVWCGRPATAASGA